MIKRFDANNDKFLSKEEFTSLIMETNYSINKKKS